MTIIVEIFTDGACSGNPGPGGWGAYLRYGEKTKRMSGAEIETTNNRMELTAPIMALRSLSRSCTVKITTDSKYVQQGITEWLPNWKKRNWKTASNKPVKNADLWKALEAESIKHDVSWHWVKGHAGHTENEIADELATSAIQTLRGDGS